MKNISRFFTLYWIVYFPTCIAYNDLPGFSSVDEAMTLLLLLYTFMMYGSKHINKKPWKEFMVCLGLFAFYVVYSFLFGANVKDAVWLDLMQEIRYVDSEPSVYEKAEEVDVNNHDCHVVLMDYVSSTSLRFTSGG